jgi:lipoic acid synthetase
MQRLPAWLRNPKELSCLRDVRLKLRKGGLSTVCEEARCPNISECFSKNEATFLILGDVCTRGCLFCSVGRGIPACPDDTEPINLATAAAELGLTHVVITSVTRDDLEDKGAKQFAACIKEIKQTMPDASVEVLTPDFSGDTGLIDIVLDEKPDVFAHNVETVRRLYPIARAGADLDRSLSVISSAGISGKVYVKTGFMVGLGETEDEIAELIKEIRDAGADILTIGQYLRPTKNQLEVARYYEAEAFDKWAELAKETGIRYVVSGPFVRSSYRAGLVLNEIRKASKQSMEE